jgi:hypothetical protein
LQPTTSANAKEKQIAKQLGLKPINPNPPAPAAAPAAAPAPATENKSDDQNK